MCGLARPPPPPVLPPPRLSPSCYRRNFTSATRARRWRDKASISAPQRQRGAIRASCKRTRASAAGIVSNIGRCECLARCQHTQPVCCTGHVGGRAGGRVSECKGETGRAWSRSSLDSIQAWVPDAAAPGQWLEMDLGRVMPVAGVVTQVRQTSPEPAKRTRH